jgi:hypothetical protein
MESPSLVNGGVDKDDSQPSAEIQNPLVFQCSKCRIIIGDSYSFQCSHEEMKTITLTAASNIQRSADVLTSKYGADVGSTYFTFSCSECDSDLGKYYLTTSSDLDELRERFTFHVDNISSYELGKSQHGSMPEHVPQNGTEGVETIEERKANSDLKALETRLDGHLLKIKHVLLAMNTRLEQLEEKDGPGLPQKRVRV